MAITSEYSKLPHFLAAAALACDLPLSCHDALMRNSDHYNFAVGGIPAFRLVAGFDLAGIAPALRADTGTHQLEDCCIRDMQQAVQLTTWVVVSALTTETLDLRA